MPTTIARRQHWFLAILLFAVTSLILFNPPQHWRDLGWFDDGGLTLDTADQLLHGKQLFSQVFYQYGPASIEIYVLWCRIFGNTISSFEWLNLLIALVNCLLLFKVLERAGLAFSTLAIAFIALVPTLLATGYVFYSNFEKTLILMALLVWKPPEQRSFKRSLALGAVIGLMQWVRFGAAVGVLGAVFILDLILERAFSRGSIATTLSYLAGFFAVEGALAARLLLTLPKDVALDTLWPQFMAGSYSVYVTENTRFPILTTLNFFIGGQLPIIVCALLAVGAVFLLVRSRLSKTSRVLAIPFFTFLIYCLIYYKQAWHYYNGAWLLVLPAAAAIDRLSMKWKAGVAVLLLPLLLIAARADLRRSPARGLEATTLPNGERLWLPPEVIRRNQSLMDRLREVPDGPSRRGVLFLSRMPVVLASHLHFFYQIPQPARHSMIFPGWLRLRDFENLPVVLEHSKAVVLFQSAIQGPPPQDACQWESHPYPRPYCEEISARLEAPVKVDDTCWIFPLSSPGSPVGYHR